MNGIPFDGPAIAARIRQVLVSLLREAMRWMPVEDVCAVLIGMGQELEARARVDGREFDFSRYHQSLGYGRGIMEDAIRTLEAEDMAALRKDLN